METEYIVISHVVEMCPAHLSEEAFEEHIALQRTHPSLRNGPLWTTLLQFRP